MSELVEKVARAMYPSWWETIDTCTDGANCESCPLDRAHSLGKSRAAIAAVAEWLDEHHKQNWLESENHASSALRSALEAKP